MKTGVQLWLYGSELFVELDIFLIEGVEENKRHFVFNNFIEKSHHL